MRVRVAAQPRAAALGRVWVVERGHDVIPWEPRDEVKREPAVRVPPRHGGTSPKLDSE